MVFWIRKHFSIAIVLYKSIYSWKTNCRLEIGDAYPVQLLCACISFITCLTLDNEKSLSRIELAPSEYNIVLFGTNFLYITMKSPHVEQSEVQVYVTEIIWLFTQQYVIHFSIRGGRLTNNLIVFHRHFPVVDSIRVSPWFSRSHIKGVHPLLIWHCRYNVLNQHVKVFKCSIKHLSSVVFPKSPSLHKLWYITLQEITRDYSVLENVICLEDVRPTINFSSTVQSIAFHSG